MMNHSYIRLREMEPADGPGIQTLIADPNGFMTTYFQIDPYVATIQGTEERTIGAVVESEHHDGLVGMVTLRYSEVQFNGELLPAIGLDSLHVAEELRGHGIGAQLVAWCDQRVQAEFGKNCVRYSGTASDNYASKATLKRWSKELIEPVQAALAPVCHSPPRTIVGITVRVAEPHEYEEFAHKQNHFFREHNLYDPITPAAIAHQATLSPGGQQVYRFYVAVDTSGNLLSGARVWFRGLLKADHINNPPLALRMMNTVLRLLPSDYVLRDIGVTCFWYDADRPDTAGHLWEAMRWYCRDDGTTLMVSFDPQDPARTTIPLKPWHQPRPQIAVAVQGPTPLDRGRLLYNRGRV